MWNLCANMGIFVKKTKLRDMVRQRISTLDWRKYIEYVTPADRRIGTDVMLVDDDDFLTQADTFVENEPFKTDMSMAIFCEQGAMVLKINMKEYAVVAPAMVIILAEQICESVSHSDDLRGRVIVMSKSFTNSLFVSFGDTIPLYTSVFNNPIMKMEGDSFVFNMYYDLLKNLVSSPSKEFKLEAARHLTLSLFYGYSHMRHEASNSIGISSRQEEIYAEFLDVLRANYKKYRGIGFYAQQLCITPKHLSKVVKDVSGQSALNIINEYVISESKALLHSTTKSIQQISNELNFATQSVFGKYFKRLTGKSPKEYRKRQM